MNQRDDKIDPIELGAIKGSVDLVKLAGESVVLYKTGKLYRGLCPFHEEHGH